jgi:methylmalonic aciduria homocystinuria type C protein
MTAELGSPYLEFGVACRDAGLDLVSPFQVEWYNRRVVAADSLPNFGRASALGLLIGNTRELWGRFRAALELDAELRADPHPLDAYVVARLTSAVQQITAPTAIVWAHRIEPRALPVQRVAEVAALAAISPSHLSIHPTHGPWFALRAVVVVDAEGPAGEPPPLISPCATCQQPCVPALDEALRASERAALPLSRAVRTDWRRWARVREVCPVGPLSRYSDEQIEYHYTKDRERILRSRPVR